jgi:dynein heavy chain
MEIQNWILHGLPLDDVSKENAIIMKITDQTPLLIDPQNQASRFLRRLETKITDKNFVQTKPSKGLEKQLEFVNSFN